MRANRQARAQLDHELTQHVREGDDDGDWQAAGCSSSAQWVALVSHSDYGTAKRITDVSEALREQPAIGHAMSTGELTLDQGAAALKHATPETDAQIARALDQQGTRARSPSPCASSTRRPQPMTRRSTSVARYA